jgi:CRP-like cAMP-binding protein
VLLEDPELAGRLTGERLRAAARVAVSPVVQLSSGSWSPTGLADGRAIGLLILDGLIIRRVGVGGRFGAELLGEGDLLRPWQREDPGTTLPRIGRWQALLPCRIAILDGDFAASMARFPEVTSALFARAVRRSRHTVVAMAIVHQPRVDVRLRMLFWELADRWGTVHSDGVRVPLQLTHHVLADLVAARRPTVSKALGELAERGIIAWTGDHWLLSGNPPMELDSVGSISVKPAASFVRSGPGSGSDSSNGNARKSSDTSRQKGDEIAGQGLVGALMSEGTNPQTRRSPARSSPARTHSFAAPASAAPRGGAPPARASSPREQPRPPAPTTGRAA